MTRQSLKCGGKARRKKAVFGADGAIMAGATLAAAAMTTAATAKAAKEQAQAVETGAINQAQSIKDQAALQKESVNTMIESNKQMNKENQDIMRDQSMTLQALAGQQNMNDRMEANKKQLKFGGKAKRRSVKRVSPFYGGARYPFTVTDGGGAIPIQIDSNGYGLYELYGNDHNHYHKTRGGKYKSGVGIKFTDGSVVEGEGDQNTNRGEVMLVTPNDAYFYSKHNIAGFNPANAIKAGMDPRQVLAIQENNKDMLGIADDGTRQTSSPVEECGGRVSIKRHKAKSGTVWDNYGGSIMNAAGNVGGALISTIGNAISSRRLARAYNRAGNMIADAYNSWTGIDENAINREDFAAPHSLAAIRLADTNINPQLERARRNADAEARQINRGTLSSAARNTRLAETNDRMLQRMSEQYAWKHNQDEQIKQGNAERITQVAQANAERDMQANKDYTTSRIGLLQYNNDIKNAAIAGAAQAKADALVNAAGARADAINSSASAWGSALTSSASGFAKNFNSIQNYNQGLGQTIATADGETAHNAMIRMINNPYIRRQAENYIKVHEHSKDDIISQRVAELKAALQIK